jgi:hypothetical protein
MARRSRRKKRKEGKMAKNIRKTFGGVPVDVMRN